MGSHESFPSNAPSRNALSPEIEKSQNASRERQKSKLISFYISGGDDGYVFESNTPEFSNLRVTPSDKKRVLDTMRENPNAYRNIERQLLGEIAYSNHPTTPNDVWGGIRRDLHQSKILAEMTGVSWSNLQQLSGANVATFLSTYPTPIDFERSSQDFLNMIRQNNPPAKYDEYVKSMDDFCAQIYGKKYEYYKAMEELKKEAHEQPSPRPSLIERGKKALSALSSVFGEVKNRAEKLVVGAGLATINKAEFTGAKDRKNEDAAYSDVEKGLFGVFDGAGGEAGGARASSLAVSIMSQMATERTPASPNDLVGIMRAINTAVCNDRDAGFSTGVIGRIIEENGKKKLIYVSVGDSRAYLARRGKAVQLTTDEGQGRYIYNSLGDRSMKVEQIREVSLQKGDRIVFCSDGITGDYEHDKMTNEELATIVSKSKTPQQAAEQLTKQAKKIDDRTALVFEV